MEAVIARGLSGLDPIDLECRDQEALTELIATYFDSKGEALEGKRSWSKSKLTTATV